MAELSTDVMHADGVTVVMTVPGRVAKVEATRQARAVLEQDARRIAALLQEADNWTTRARRGFSVARTYEELHGGS